MDSETKAELEATVEARRELGPAHDQELIDGFLDRLGTQLDRRIDERIAARTPPKRAPSPLNPGNLGVCIPLIVLAGVFGHTAGVFFGLSYLCMFAAYYHGRVTVVSPLVATESLWGVFFSALVIGRSEHVGRRIVAGAALIVAGGVLIGLAATS